MILDEAFYQKKAEYEQLAQELVGHRIAMVREYGLAVSDDENPDKDAANARYISAALHTDHHELDFGLDVVLDSGATFGFIWGNDFRVCYSVSIIRYSLRQELYESLSWEMTHHESWSALIDQEIQKVRVGWAWEQTTVITPEEVKELFQRRRDGTFHDDPPFRPAAMPGPRDYFPITLVLCFANDRSVYIHTVSDKIFVIFDEKSAEYFRVIPLMDIDTDDNYAR